ncbi:hypothetical protein FJY93_00335 [Candidatus Kaiserbacteria bacterium]|nr:hypothetical protein [Candidatus Kaiserbacteria bacterium]
MFESWFNKKKQGEKPQRKIADAKVARMMAAGIITAVSNTEPAHGIESQQPSFTSDTAIENTITATPAAEAAIQKLAQMSFEDGKAFVEAFRQTSKNPEDLIYDPAQDLYDAILNNPNHGLSEELVQYIKNQIQEVNE